MSGVSNFNPQNIPTKFNTLSDDDIQARRLHTMQRNLYACLEEVKALDGEVEPQFILDAGEETNYQTQVTALRTKVKEAIAALVAIDDLRA